MTTPPKARRYHLTVSESIKPEGIAASPHIAAPRLEVARRPGPVADAAAARAVDDGAARMETFLATGPVDDGFGDLSMAPRLDRHASDRRPPTPDSPARGAATDGTPTQGALSPATGAAPDADASPAAVPGADTDLEAKLVAIRAEKLSERQMRIARRIAALHQIEVASDEEAVLRLRERGIDPGHRSSLGSILASAGSRAQAAPATNPPALRKTPLPQAAPSILPVPRPALPSREELTEEKRATEIYRIQRDLARRRRRRLAMLAARLVLFVLLPTLLVGWYYFRIASPLYATESQFQIQSAEGAGVPGGLGAALGGAGLGTNQDAVAVQSYLTSRDAMLRLDADLGFRRAYQDPTVDPVKRLPADATNEATYGLYKNSVRIGYDPTEGVLNMEVIAPDPQLSERFSRALISYAEQLVDALTSRMRSDQMEGARATYEDAEAKMLAAQARVQGLQERLGVLDPVAESSVVMTQVSLLETQLAERQLELGQLMANPQPLQSRVAAAEGDIARLRELIDRTRRQLTEGNDTRSSLAAIGGELRVAEAEMLTRQEMLAAAAAQMETARIEANKQVRYLSLSIVPIPPDEATYPRAFQNTLVAFLIFSGIYLMLSLTASILREQVST